MDATGSTDLEPRELTFVDFPADAVDTHSTGGQNNNINSGLPEAFCAEKAMDTADASGLVEQLSQSSEPSEPGRTRNTGKCNLRKSLAWDAAFFTSAGVLDPDELSNMIKVDGKGERHLLSGIAEDISRSTDSFSTLESDSLTLENAEADLFEDIRASIQKSSKASNMTSSSKAANHSSPFFKEGAASENMVKSKHGPKKHTIGMQGPGKLMKRSSGCTQPVAKIGGLTPSLPKPPNAIGRPNPILPAAPKKAYLSSKDVKMGNEKAKCASAQDKMIPVSKTPGDAGSGRTVPKLAGSLKSPSMRSSAVTRKDPPRSSSSSSSFHSQSSSDVVGVSPVKSNRRRIGSRTVNQASSSLALKTPSKVALKQKGQADLPAKLMSPKLSSNISPASSISEWSLESSSSTSAVSRRSDISRASFSASSPRRSLNVNASSGLDNRNQSVNQISDMHEHKAARLSSENLKTFPRQAGASTSVKPTGLRMPSPKIGFFDGVKSVVRTPYGTMQPSSGIPAGPKTGVRNSSPSGGSNKAKPAKLQPKRTVGAIGNTRPDVQKPALTVPSKKPSKASTKVSNVSGDAKKCISIPHEVQNGTEGENQVNVDQKGTEGYDRDKDVPEIGQDAGKTGSLGVLKGEIDLEEQGNANSKDTEISPVECIMPSEEADEATISSIQHLNKSWDSPYRSNEKQNGHREKHVDGLSTDAVVITSEQEPQKDLVCNSIAQTKLAGPDFSAPEPSCSEELHVSASILMIPSLVGSSETKVASTRTPFLVKNSLCNSEEDVSRRLSNGAIDKKASIPPSESAQIENI
ncbi:uncharacterized protein LOC127790032 isoform X2 [Diospyros lotus]|uniref:uncharacterized protein LOC127790032 isoform X2 n=1 Tax=Diospyros lotus TaxID=55363 RepID=UPI002254589A|nr:uncharacterized protein LOC127790032 isoform X2 [Diospyros lotus]